MPINSLGVMQDRARLESIFQGVNSSAPTSSPAGGGGVYHVRSNPGPAPVNRGRPLPSGGLQFRYNSNPANPVNPDYIGSPATRTYSGGISSPSSPAPGSFRGGSTGVVNNAAAGGYRADPFVQYQPGYGRTPATPVNAANSPAAAPSGVNPGRPVSAKGAGFRIGGRGMPGGGGMLLSVGMMAIQAEMDRRDWPTYADYVAEQQQLGNLDNVPGWMLGEEYPNQLDPDALTQGLMLEDATPESGGVGSVAGAIYGLFGSGASGTVNGSPQMLGPILNERIEPRPLWTGYIDYYQVWDVPNLPPPSTYAVFLGRNSMGPAYSWARVDGGTDPPYQPAQPPTYAPNPARSSRQPTTPGAAPNLLPAPPVPSPAYQPGGDLPWPQTQPQAPPDTQPLAPPQDAPNFSPPPTEAPSTPTNPFAPPGPPDLDPNAPPRDAPNLADDPDTPTRPAGSPGDAFTESPTEGPQTWPRITKLRDGTEIIEQENGDRQIRWPYGREDVTRQLFSPPVLPVPIPVGARWPVNTPSSPNLVNNPADNPNVRRVEQPVRQTPTEGPKGSCFYEFQRVADIQAKATDTNTKANNPVSGFPGLYGIGIESRVKLGETFTLLQTVNNFMRTAWRATRMDKVLNVLTFIGVMHNVSMLSRDVGDTFFQLISQALQAAGIRNEEDQVIDVGEVVGDTVENFLKGVLGEERYHGINEAWNKANRIIQSANAILWTVRSIADSSLDLMEWIGENTGRIGNALKRWGVVSERSYPWMSESARAQSRFRSRFSKVNDALENAEDRISVGMQATSLVIEIQDEVEESKENWMRFKDSVRDGIPDPWLDNSPVQEANATLKEYINNVPDVLPSEAQKG
ncbi:hypothetical protein [Phormidium sp. FACHB-1136]|uniref:hypothetical protein n=1 Tax=Phormidium sp. FACHB-1136 TaxID=2692848 RepID=UPI001681CD4B|nr:hypothetical protein [Phormidium sp. FACHB-1136]MBD2425262.1 hypothetical protein [Phormidium sp. FACHB-1136]